MHNVFLGLLSNHGKELFGLKISGKKASNRTNTKHFGQKSPTSESNHESDSKDDCKEDFPDDDVTEDPEVAISEELKELLKAFQDLDLSIPTSPSDSDSCSSEGSTQSILETESESNQDPVVTAENDIPTMLNPLGARARAVNSW
ncbi:hypothetical protein PtA15_10A259 [Puccinia triticina]|uniref:Uncharacterized protein n=1 Tax=Puccinia triticina TaxID=208348 RepID=A0ABY7CW21_9BASI|nr:uncharacterized protein PtA15_10A259 [Puccinia triticina]WAQ88839.1 hypothetical protein PtA15_10A259 [Puccinia triticina]